MKEMLKRLVVRYGWEKGKVRNDRVDWKIKNWLKGRS